MSTMIYSGKTKYDIYVTHPEDDESKTVRLIKAVDEFSVEVGIQGFTLAWMKDGEYSEEDFPNCLDVKALQSETKSAKLDLSGFEEVKVDKSDDDSDDEYDDDETVPVICKDCLDKHIRHVVHEELAGHLSMFALDMFDAVHADVCDEDKEDR